MKKECCKTRPGITVITEYTVRDEARDHISTHSTEKWGDLKTNYKERITKYCAQQINASVLKKWIVALFCRV
jgi:hypothetical protein